MEEKTSEPLAETPDPPVTIVPDESNAEDVSSNLEELLPTGEGSLQPAESVKEECLKEESFKEESNVEASLISTDTNDEVLESNLNPDESPPVETAISEDNDIKMENNGETPGVTDEIAPTIVNSEDTKSNDTNKEPENENVELPISEPMEIEPTEQRTEQMDPQSAVYQLEEELKRLHGDTSEESKTDSFIGDLSVSAILEDTVDSTLKNDNLDNATSKSSTLINIRKYQDEKPIMKDSDLEEMLSADDVMKDPVLIREAQEDLKATDILLCGRCHDVYHFVEEYQNHKNQGCTAKSTILPICEGESKPQVWGFTLWKTKQNKSLKPGEPVPTSWRTYQKWCKLPPLEKNAWISAGQTIQFCHKVASAKVAEIKAKPQANADKDPLALDSIESNKENSNSDNSLRTKTTVKNETSIKTNDVNTNSAIRTPSKGGEKSEFAVERIVAKRFNPKKKCWEYQIKWEHFASDQNTWEPLANLTHCKKLVDNFEEQLRKLKADKAKQVATVSKNRNSSMLNSSSVESSTGGRPQRSSKQKALNQVKAWCGNISDDDGMGLKRKLEDDDSDDSFEKKLKTEDFSDDSDFELNSLVNTSSKAPPLRKIQQKSAQTGIQIFKNGLDKSGPLPHNILIPDANGVVRINQKQLPSLSTGVYIMSKTAGIIKLDSTTSKVAASGGQTIVKVAPKIGQTQIKIVKKDGSTTATTKQVLPAISNTSTPIVTKVYKPVITKVKKPAESPKKTPEILRKTVETTRRPSDGVKKISPGEVKRQLETTKIGIGHSKIFKKEEPKKTLTSMMDMSAPEDDSDDGLEELPFPEDIKIPEPESPPSDFTLDPITGKIAGVEYPEKPEIDQAEADHEPSEEAKSDTSLDNIVKLAAADITEDDLKNDDPMEVESMTHQDQEDEEEELLHIPEKKASLMRNESMTGTGMSKTIVRMPIGATNRLQAKQPQRQPGSILNKVLTGAPIIRRTAVTPGIQKVQQRVVNQSVLKNPYGTIVRVGNTTYVRKSPTIKKTRPYFQSPANRAIRAQHDPSAKNVYTYSRQVVQGGPRKIGNTTIRQAASLDMIAQQQKLASSQSLIANRPRIHPGSSPIVRRVVHGTPGNAQSSPVKKDFLIRQHQEQQRKVVMPTRTSKPVHPLQHQQLTKPKAVINMPSLLGDDESETDPGPPEFTKPTSPPPTSPFTSAVMSTPTGLLDSSTMGESMSESMQEAMTAQVSDEAMEHQNSSAADAEGTGTVTDLSSFTLTDNENPIFITGDDGTVYQVAGQNEQGQTILLTQGSDGQQQCLLVTSEVAEAMEAAAEQPDQPAPEVAAPEISENLTEPLSIKTEVDTNDQVVAQVVRAEPPSPGGTHKVVVMLPDGNLMVTQVSPEEYASLELE